MGAELRAGGKLIERDGNQGLRGRGPEGLQLVRIFLGGRTTIAVSGAYVLHHLGI